MDENRFIINFMKA